ncbi:MAG: bifunctional DNA-formamidopyrimidine glycosylase/DNA-(apurinic or apyrimidinic site) lyase [Candidatus Latescibacterota bacterium]|nr:MAG: bifunctional DNA-formamidopyrimidine glycosylase/DNA-(apurinic or apyrimidinic site) lyase [Candidatus Latescibacterota bacterium]
MPELPEVETIVRGLREPLLGRRLLRARLRYAALYRKGSLRVTWLVGRVITAVERVGKNAVFRFDRSRVMTINLGMTGRLVLVGADNTGRPATHKHRHGRFIFDHGVELDFYDPRRFGYVYITGNADLRSELNLGPDPFEISTSGRELGEALRGRRAPIKSILLDQRIIAGIGNIYADETLFAARIDPLTPAGDVVSRSRELLAAARKVLRRAIDHGGSTVRDYRRSDGSSGEFQQHHAVYGREGDPCLVCGEVIERIVLSGRSTHFCSLCQK